MQVHVPNYLKMGNTEDASAYWGGSTGLCAVRCPQQSPDITGPEPHQLLDGSNSKGLQVPPGPIAKESTTVEPCSGLGRHSGQTGEGLGSAAALQQQRC